MIKGGTLRETMNELGHHDIQVAVGYYQRVVPEHQREVSERLASDYLPMEDAAMMEKPSKRSTGKSNDCKNSEGNSKTISER